jgi:hypothetical protein
MKRIAIFLAAVLLFSAAFPAQAKIRHESDLTTDEVLALQRSEQRLVTYDHALDQLDANRWHRKMSRTQFEFEQRQLVAFIGCEARYQNDILIDDRPFPPEDAREVMENIAKYAVMAAEVIGYVAVRIAPAFSGISP